MRRDTGRARTGQALRSGDTVLLSILAADFFGAVAGALVHLTMVWWVLDQGKSGQTLSLMVLSIFLPLNIGVLLTGIAVERFGSKRLLIVSKLVATCGAASCLALLAAERMTLPALALVAILTYGAMAPSVAADISRVPALTRLAARRLESFHAANGIGMVLGQLSGLWAAGLLWETTGPVTSLGLGVGMVLISTLLTWIGFPRDRIPPRNPQPALRRIAAMSRAVMDRLRGPQISLSSVLVTAAIIATAQGCIEIAFPLAVAAAGLPATALSLALVLAVFTGVGASLIAQAVYARVRLGPSLLTISMALLAILLAGTQAPGILGFYTGVGATSAAASGAATLTVTALQRRMPASLQAQAIGLWEFLVLGVGSVTILLTGAMGAWSLAFIALIAAAATLGAARDVLAQRKARPAWQPDPRRSDLSQDRPRPAADPDT